MDIFLKREASTELSTIGELTIPDLGFRCWVLEDPVRPVKIATKTAIAEGRYEVIVNWSNRFKRNLPLLLNVPEFQGIRIHAGNTADDTEGCLLVGHTRKRTDFIGRSKAAFDVLNDIITEALSEGKVFITILNPTKNA